MYRLFINTALAAAITLGVDQAIAQTDTTELSLNQCLTLASQRNLELRQAEMQVEMRRTQMQTHRTQFLPILGANVGQSWSFGRSEDHRGVYIDRSSAATNLGVSASAQLFTGLRRYHDLKAAKLNHEASLKDLEQAKQDLGIRITQYYYSAVFAQETLRAARQSSALSREMRQHAEQMVSLGRWSKDKAAEMRAQSAEADLRVIEAQNILEQALLDLRLALELSTPIRLMPYNIAEELRSMRLESNELRSINLTQGINNTPSIQSALLSIEAARQGVSSARSGYLPSLSLNLGYSNAYYYQLGEQFRGLNLSLADQWRQNGRTYIGLNLNIPIFDGLRTRQQVRMMRLEVTSRQVAHAIVQRNRNKEISLAEANALLAERKIEASQHSLEASTEALDLIQAKVKIGAATPSQLSEALTRQFSAQVELAKAQSDYLLKVRILRFYLR